MIDKFIFIGCGGVGFALLEIFKKEKLYRKFHYTIIEPRDILQLDYVMKGLKYKWIKEPITVENHKSLLKDLDAKTFIINVSTGVDSIMLLKLAKEKGAMYIDTSLEQYEQYINIPIDKITKYSQFKRNNLYHQNLLAERLLKDSNKTRLVSGGMNPGLCNNYVKLILRQYAELYGKKYEKGNYGKLAHDCGLEEIQIVEYDTQKLKVKSTPSKFVNVWSSMGFTEEALDLALLSLNNHDLKKYKQEFKLIKPTEGNKDTHIRFIPERGMNLIRESIALDDKGEPFHYKGMLIPHAETITMSEFFSYKGDAPSIMYIYRPCDEAIKALEYIRQNNYKPLKDWQVVRNKDIISGWDSVCCLLKFKNGRQWIGGTILGKKDINKMKFKSGATTIQVAAFMNASIKWMLANPNEGLLQAENVPNAFIFENANKYLGLSIVREI